MVEYCREGKTKMYDDIFSNYSHIIEQTDKDAQIALQEIDNVLDDITSHISNIDMDVLSRKNELLIAIRLTEAIRMFSWIKICLYCGSYQSVFRELRFMLDSVAQGCYIDLNHFDASLLSKLEVYKALGEIGSFIGSNIFEKLKGFPKKQDLKDLYGKLSLFVHPSIQEANKWFQNRQPNEMVYSMISNKYNRELLDHTIEKCKEVGVMLISIDNYFIDRFLNKIKEVHP